MNTKYVAFLLSTFVLHENCQDSCACICVVFCVAAESNIKTIITVFSLHAGAQMNIVVVMWWGRCIPGNRNTWCQLGARQTWTFPFGHWCHLMTSHHYHHHQRQRHKEHKENELCVHVNKNNMEYLGYLFLSNNVNRKKTRWFDNQCSRRCHIWFEQKRSTNKEISEMLNSRESIKKIEWMNQCKWWMNIIPQCGCLSILARKLGWMIEVIDICSLHSIKIQRIVRKILPHFFDAFDYNAATIKYSFTEKVSIAIIHNKIYSYIMYEIMFESSE